MDQSFVRLLEAFRARVPEERRQGRELALLADLMEASPQSLNNWKARGLSKEAAFTAQRVFGCNPSFLREGEGRPFVDDPAPPLAGVDQMLSQPGFKVPPLKTREEVLSGRNLGELFTYTVTDDATWKSYPRGLQIIFRTTGEPRIGKAVLVASGDSVHVRIFAQGATESDWSAVAQGDGYKDFHSSDGSVIRGYYKGQIDPDD